MQKPAAAAPPAQPPALAPAPVAARPRVQVATVAPRACVGVIAGVHRTQECL
jgi:pilus assembly protein CpaB